MDKKEKGGPSWVRLSYLNLYGKIIHHTVPFVDSNGIQAILERYDIPPENVIEIEIGGKVYSLKELGL